MSTPPLHAAPVGCPPTAPTAGATCTGNLECEYGTSLNPACNDNWQCSAGVWLKISTEGQCPPAGAPMCPATYDAANTDKGKCAPEAEFCVYPQGTCICTDDPGGLPRAGGPEWGCTPVTAGCPAAPPRLGTPCKVPESTECDYGACNGGVDMQCTDGHWAISMLVGCPA